MMASTVMRSKSCCSMRRKQSYISRKASDSSLANRQSVSRKTSNCSNISGCSDPCLAVRRQKSASRTSSNSSFTSYIRRKDSSVSQQGVDNNDRKVSVGSTGSANSNVVRVGALEEVVDNVQKVGRGCGSGCGCGVYVGVVTGGWQVSLHCHHKTPSIKGDLLRHPRPNLPAHPALVQPSPYLYETDGCYVVVEEAGPCGSVRQAMQHSGGVLDEATTKRVVGQVAAALQQLHLNRLVHRDLSYHVVQAVDPHLREVRLAGLGRVRTSGERVVRAGVRAEWVAPEVAWAVEGESYIVDTAQDAWSLGVLVVMCLTGRPPWNAAHISDPHYRWWAAWATRTTTRPPPRFRCFTPRLLRLLRRLLQPKVELRSGVSEVNKYMDDAWLTTNKPNRPKLDQRLAATAAPLLARARAAFARIMAPPLTPALAAQAHARRVRFAGDSTQDLQECQDDQAVSPPA